MLETAKLWVYAARPKTLLVSVSPVMIGSFMSLKFGDFSLAICFWTLLAAIAIQVGTNYSNDYFDFLKKADTCKRKGNYKLLERELVTPVQMKLAFTFAYGIAGLSTLFLIRQGGFVILLMAAVSIVFSILYTAGPFSLAYTGLADIFVFIFFGPIATILTFYLQTLNVTSDIVIASVAPGLLSIAPLTINNMRDYNEDKAVGKKTLIVRFGLLYGKLQYIYITTLSFCVPLALVIYSSKNICLITASLSLLLSLPLIKTMFTYKDPKELNPLLGKSTLILGIYSLLFSIFWLI